MTRQVVRFVVATAGILAAFSVAEGRQRVGAAKTLVDAVVPSHSQNSDSPKLSSLDATTPPLAKEEPSSLAPPGKTREGLNAGRSVQGLKNNNCGHAIPIFNGPTDFDTTGATTDGLQHESCQFDGQTYNDIWYRYIATCSGNLNVNTCWGLQYDSDLVVYDGCPPDDWVCPPGDDELLGCNDDTANCGPAFGSDLTVPVVLGNCYTVRVGGWFSSDMGAGTLTLLYYDCDFCGNGTCDPEIGENLCTCPEDCPGACPCTLFTDQTDFETFNAEEGKSLKGIEDFEESILPPASVDGLDDPLCGGIPNSPDGVPFPDGLTQLNLCVQSNILGAAPVDPAPGGLDGLAAASAGFLGINSDVVLCSTFLHGLDIMLVSPPVLPGEEDDHTGVGFNTITALGGDTVDIQVFDKNNVLLVTASSPVDVVGTNFWGIWCEDPIGRINIFDPSNGAEGADNIQLWHDVTCEPPCVEPAVCIEGACCGDGIVEGHEECDYLVECGTCPWDVDGDGNVGPFDLAFLLGNWGPIPPNPDPAVVCLDVDESGHIGPFDLASLLGNWGECPLGFGGTLCSEADCLENCECVRRGACCGVKGDPGACEDNLTEEECAQVGGEYAGDDTTCDDCPNPACFGAEGSCFEAHGGPGCCNSLCCAIVCAFEPDCCESWDEICVGIAEDLCPIPTCGDGCCDPGEDGCSCPAECPGTCPCTIFTNQAEFEAFNEEEGKALKGVEDFEEGILPPNAVEGLDDPLCGGIPSSPAGTPYPAGLDQLNMCVQSNTLGEFPVTPAPAGLIGLAAASNGFAGALSDVVISNTFVNSLDMMFTSPPAQEEDDHTGVGFNTITLLGGTTVDIHVFNKANQLLVENDNVAAPADGTGFWGIWCADPIGRINIWDPGNGAEGGDNIQLWVQADGVCGDGGCTAGEDCENCPQDCGACPMCGNGVIEEGEECDPPGPGGCGGEVCLPDCTCGDLCGDGICSAGEDKCKCSQDCPGECTCVIFFDPAEFEAFNEDEGKALKGVEDFEEGTLPPAAVAGMDDPLCGGIPSSPPGTPYPKGLLQLNLCVQSNLLGGAPDVPKPAGFGGIRAISAGFQGAVSDIVTSGTFVNSFDIIFSEPNHTGVGFNPIVILGGATSEIRVYDPNEGLLVMETVPADAAGSNFFGVSCHQSIGRINFFDVGNGVEGADNIQMWVFPTGECGDDTCQPGETCANCPEDCGPCPFCGDGEVNQPSEECDPPGFPSTCPNNEACLPDCTCGDLCGDELCSGDEDECSCPQDCSGVCPECVFFFDQAEFEAFNEGRGQLMKGFEDFEESTLPPFGVEAMDDPLCGGIPNLPDGFPFPDGLEEPNLCVQSNFDHLPEAPNPRGVNGLAAVSAGFFGVGSDIVLPNFFVDSLDLMFTGLAHTAVGFDTLSASGGLTAQVRVYGEDNVLLALEVVPLDEAAINFTGVWCNLPIGRINLFDPANGAEGGDNIQMWSILECGDGACAGETCETCPEDCGPCPFCGDGEVNQPSEECDPPGFPSACPNNEACLPDCTCGDLCGDELCSGDEHECSCPQDCPGECPCIFFFDPAEFEAFNEQEGLILKGIETFEESVLPPGTVDGLDDSLCGGIPNSPDGFPFPNGLTQLNLCVQSNNLGGDPTMPSPSGSNGLAAVSAGFLGAISDIVVASTFLDSFDMIFSEPNHRAIGFDTISILGSGTVEIRVYDENEILLVMGAAPVDPAGSNFFGVWCNLPISRVNVFDTGDDAEGADNIQMWVGD